MAGRYVLLEFDDPKLAEEFVYTPNVMPYGAFEVAAIFVKPKKFCECPDKQRQNGKNWTKGKRTGLYLCIKCRRPSAHHQTGVFKRLAYVFGNNLLEN